MKIVHIDDVPLMRGLEHRGGTFHARTMVEGQPGHADNFKFSLSRLGTDYSGPRHRHNFDQFRFQIEGESDYGDGALKPGMLGYYPEGVPYGPQINKTEIYGAVLQFGGASGSGYLLPREVKAGMEELKPYGEFKDGVYHRHDGVPGKRSMDAYQAIWEHVHRRPMVYPKARYDAPVFMDSANYQWMPVKGEAGVSEKLFGVWTERRTEAGLIKLEAGASYRVHGRGVYLLLSGAGECEGKTLKQYGTLFLDYGESATLHANEMAEFLHYGLPDFSQNSVSLSRSANEMQAGGIGARPAMIAQPSRRKLLTGMAGGALSLGLAPSVAQAAQADSFYRGKTLNVIVGFAPGGGVDTASRVIATHLARFIPGQPRTIVQNMEGAAGIISSNYLYQRVPPDGLTIGVPGRSWFVEGAIKVQGVRFDPTKFSYVGSPGAVNSVVYVRSSTGVKSVEDLKASKRILSFGALGNLTPTAMVPYMLAAQGMPIRVVVGYVSSARIIVALEQGEVDGYFTVEATFGLRQELVEKNVIIPIMQNKPVHPGIPLIRDVLPKSDGALLTVVMALETFGLPVIGPPGIPAERLDVLRKAFVAMCGDKEYRADAVKVDLPVGAPLDGGQLDGMIRELGATATPAIIERYKRLGTPV